MDDDQIAVELVAKVDQLQEGMAEGKAAVEGALGGIRNDLHQLEETAKESEGVLKEILNGEAFIVFKEKAELALEAVKGAFEATVGAAEGFGISNARFAAIMGMSEEQAAGLSAALRGVGSSAQEYETIALRLQQRVNANEQAMNQLGIQTRGANGELLGGKDLMDSAIAAMQRYKTGADQNAFATEVFGRRAADVYNLMRVGDEQISHQIELYRSMGVNLAGTGESAQRTEEALNDLRTSTEALGIALGQKLMPQATAAIGWLGGQGKQLVEALAIAVKVLETVFTGLKAVVVTVVIAATASFTELYDAIKTTAILTKDVLSGNFGAVVDDWKKGTQEMADDLAAAGRTMASEWKGVADIWSTPPPAAPKAEANPFKPKGGDLSFHGTGTGKADNSAAEESIATAQKLGQEEIAIAEATNAHLLALGRESEAELVAQAKALEDQKYAIKRASLEREMALPGRTTAEQQKTADELLLLEQSHADALVKIDQDAEAKRAAVAREALSNALRESDERLREGMTAIHELAAADQIGNAEKIARERQLTASIRTEELGRLAAEIATLTPGTKAYEDAVKQKEKLERQFAADVKAINAEQRRDIEASVKTWFTPLSAGFKGAVNDMILHGKSLTEAMKAMGDQILSGFLEMLEQMAEKWAITQITNAIIAQTSQATSAVAQVSSLAAVAGAGAFASQAAIPVVGPALGAAAQAAAIADVLSLESLASAAGGMLLDRDQLVFAHKGEQVLPSNLSKGIQDLVAGRGPSVGDTTIHYSPTIQAPQSKSLATMMQEERGAFAATIVQLQRDGAFRRRLGG